MRPSSRFQTDTSAIEKARIHLSLGPPLLRISNYSAPIQPEFMQEFLTPVFAGDRSNGGWNLNRHVCQCSRPL